MGPTHNAIERALAPGASSSGTATAVAACFAPAGLAEETGSSIQSPSAAQSLVGIKPTFALVPTNGVVPLAGSTRDVVGPIATNVRDAALVLDVLAGFSPRDPKTAASNGMSQSAVTSGLSWPLRKASFVSWFHPILFWHRTPWPWWRAGPVVGTAAWRADFGGEFAARQLAPNQDTDHLGTDRAPPRQCAQSTRDRALHRSD